MWLYGSGFPKSLNIGLAIDKQNGVESEVVGLNQDILIKQKKDLELGHRKIVDSYNAGAEDRNNGFKNVSAEIKEPVSEEAKMWKGWGTQLKPSFEPIIVARKPVKGSIVNNVIEYGVGGINIDDCRIGCDEIKTCGGRNEAISGDTRTGKALGMYGKSEPINTTHIGRFPSNTILTYGETDKEEVCGGFPDTNTGWKNTDTTKSKDNITVDFMNRVGFTGNHYTDSGSASRYFYCAKASAKDRDEGLDRFEEKEVRVLNATNPELEKKDDVSSRFITVKKNTHPTVKPTELMQYLVRLVTPRGGTILDPFNGSGSTGKAVAFENRERDANYKYIGIELDKYYCDISKARIQWASVEYVYTDGENVTEELVSDLKSNINKSKGIRLW